MLEEFITFLKSEGAEITHLSPDYVQIGELKIRYFDLDKTDRLPPCKSQSINVRSDQWIHQKDQIKSKLKDRLGNNKRIFGRNCTIQAIDSSQAKEFLDRYHLLGFTNAKHQYGIFEDDRLLGVASFGKRCPIDRYGEKSMSSELKRLCFIPGTTIIGGFTKVLRHHIKVEKLDDIMTYLDRNWSTGENFEPLGFYEEETIKTHFYYDPKTKRTYFPNEINDQMILKRIEGAGSIKMIYYAED
ncbi:MAG: hypothetical protein R2799_01690 [Crocinitomicaceae bacterium]